MIILHALVDVIHLEQSRRRSEIQQVRRVSATELNLVRLTNSPLSTACRNLLVINAPARLEQELALSLQLCLRLLLNHGWAVRHILLPSRLQPLVSLEGHVHGLLSLLTAKDMIHVLLVRVLLHRKVWRRSVAFL